MIPPILLLAILLAITIAAAIWSRVGRIARSHKLQELARSWKMRYTPDDRFALTERITPRLPVPGAADVVVRDIVFDQLTGGCFRYLFTVEYTTGVLRTKRRRVSVASVAEGGCAQLPWSDLTIAPEDLDMQERYQWLRNQSQAK